MLRKNIILYSIVFSLCFLGGCANKETSETTTYITENSEDSNKVNIPEHIESVLSSGVEVDADIDVPELDTKDVSIYQGAILKFDIKKISDALLINPAVQSTQENEAVWESNIYRGEDGSEIASSEDKWMKFHTAKFAQIHTDFDTETISDEQRDFDFASRSEADINIRKVLKLLEAEIYPEYECVSLDYETLKEKNLEQFAGMEEIEEVQEDLNALKAIPWSPDYNCYCFTYYSAIDGIKLNSKDRETNTDIIPGSYIRAVYSKDGLQSLEISNIYYKQETLDEKSLCSMNTVLRTIDEKYNSIILQGSYRVTSMELLYIADIRNEDEGYTLLPVWRCQINHEYETQDKTSSEIVNIEEESTLLIDAVSGTEIYSGGSI